MRLLLDECVARDLKRDLVGHEVATVVEAGYSGMNNGALLRAASGNYDVFITVDRNLPFQQNIASLPSFAQLISFAIIFVAPTLGVPTEGHPYNPVEDKHDPRNDTKPHEMDAVERIKATRMAMLRVLPLVTEKQWVRCRSLSLGCAPEELQNRGGDTRFLLVFPTTRPPQRWCR